MIIKKIFIFTALLAFTTLIYSQFNYRTNQATSTIQLTGEDYITGDDGVARMSINIWGHVKYPGTYLVYDDIDILTCLSMAGGPLKGANLSDVSITSKSGKTSSVNLSNLMNNSKTQSVNLKPNDTIYIDENLSSYLLSRTGVITVLLQLTNLILISSNN